MKMDFSEIRTMNEHFFKIYSEITTDTKETDGIWSAAPVAPVFISFILHVWCFRFLLSFKCSHCSCLPSCVCVWCVKHFTSNWNKNTSSSWRPLWWINGQEPNLPSCHLCLQLVSYQQVNSPGLQGAGSQSYHGPADHTSAQEGKCLASVTCRRHTHIHTHKQTKKKPEHFVMPVKTLNSESKEKILFLDAWERHQWT